MRDATNGISVVIPLIIAPVANDISVLVNQSSRVHTNLSVGTVYVRGAKNELYTSTNLKVCATVIRMELVPEQSRACPAAM
jgi:hypothetical protein